MKLFDLNELSLEKEILSNEDVDNWCWTKKFNNY